MIDRPFGTEVNPAILDVPDLMRPQRLLTIGEMTQEDFARNLASLMTVVFENLLASEQKDVFNLIGNPSGGASGGDFIIVD